MTLGDISIKQGRILRECLKEGISSITDTNKEPITKVKWDCANKVFLSKGTLDSWTGAIKNQPKTIRYYGEFISLIWLLLNDGMIKNKKYSDKFVAQWLKDILNATLELSGNFDHEHVSGIITVFTENVRLETDLPGTIQPKADEIKSVLSGLLSPIPQVNRDDNPIIPGDLPNTRLNERSQLLQFLILGLKWLPVLIIAGIAILLFYADPQLFLQTDGAITLISALFVVILASMNFEIAPTWEIIGRALIILAVSISGLWSISQIGNQRVNQAIISTDIDEAQLFLDAAIRLGIPVEGKLYKALLEAISPEVVGTSIHQTTTLLTLFAENVANTSSRYQTIVESIEQNLFEAIDNNQAENATHYAILLTTADNLRGYDVANRLNDNGVNALAENNYALARIYLEAVYAIDQTNSTLRSSLSQSVTLYNLGVSYERDDSVENRLVRAEQAYRQAIRSNDHNYVVRYALSSLFLVEYANDPQRLNEAIMIAQNGRQALPTSACAVTFTSATNDEDAVWYCFLLLTTEAGLWIELGNPENATSLVERAVILAENNNQFGANRYTAEAYYYLALLPESNRNVETLCRIIVERNSDSDRHSQWATYAIQLLDGQPECGI